MPTNDHQYADVLVQSYAQRTINGNVDGVLVKAHGVLTVHGVLRGPIRIEEDAIVAVYGVLEPNDIENLGMLTVGGVVNGSSAQFDAAGKFGVAVGSIINGRIVEPDGSLRKPAEDEKITVHGTDWCAWIPDEQKFFGDN